ncbi:hypothetical protein E4U41_006494 [Claviceps citrina]|nr:hypothetical protein E4U41_006494 [Claviceps citrina]
MYTQIIATKKIQQQSYKQTIDVNGYKGGYTTNPSHTFRLEHCLDDVVTMPLPPELITLCFGGPGTRKYMEEPIEGNYSHSLAVTGRLILPTAERG